MAKLILVTREGIEHTLEGDGGVSVMEIIRDAGIDEMLAICGGCCSCATCHVYIDPSFVERMPPPSEDEDDLLDGSLHRNASSRLSCQIPFTASLEGLKVVIADED